MYYILNLKRRKFIGTQNISNALAKLNHYYFKKKKKTKIKGDEDNTFLVNLLNS